MYVYIRTVKPESEPKKKEAVGEGQAWWWKSPSRRGRWGWRGWWGWGLVPASDDAWRRLMTHNLAAAVALDKE